MLTKTKDYCDQARTLVNGGIIRNGVQHPWENMSYDPSRVRVIDFSDDSPKEQQDRAGTYFSDARHLNAYLSVSEKESKLPNRKLVFIEGLEPRMLEVVGVKYGIPASFFLGHCDEWTEINVVNQAFSKQSSPVYWRIPVPQIRRINTGALEDQFGIECYGLWNIITGNAERWDLEIRPDVGTINFRNLVSYWGMRSPSEQGSSWTAIVLVDPRPTKVRRQHMSFDLEDFHIPHKLWSEAIVWNDNSCSEQVPGLGTPAWFIRCTHRNHGQALFDEITNYFQECGLPPQNNDPMSSTLYIRNFVRSAWEEAIWRLDLNLIDEIQDDNRNKEDQRSHKPHTGGKVARSYHAWKRETFMIKNERNGVRRIMRAFRCGNDAYPKQWLDDRPSSAADIELSNLMALERRSWDLILEKLEMAEKDLCDHMEMFSQYAALLQAAEAATQTEEAGKQSKEASRQTEEANRLARSSGQLTKIATVIVPCSFVASIFSMGDEFAAGKRLFFVYWLISMPVTLILLAWVMYGDKFTAAWSKRKRGEGKVPRWPMLKTFKSKPKSSVGQSAGHEKMCKEV